MEHVTVQVRLGSDSADAYTIVGRQIEELAVTQVIGDHVTCKLVVHVDPRSGGDLESLSLNFLADAVVKVLLYQAPPGLISPLADSIGDTLVGAAKAAFSTAIGKAIANPYNDGHDTFGPVFAAIGTPFTTSVGNAFGAAFGSGITPNFAAGAGGAPAAGADTANGGAAAGTPDLSPNDLVNTAGGALGSFTGSMITHPKDAGHKHVTDVLGTVGPAAGALALKALDAAGSAIATTAGVPAGAIEALAFYGDVREAEAAYQPDGTLRFTITAKSRSYVLGEHHTQKTFAQRKIDDLAAALHVEVVQPLSDEPTDPRQYHQDKQSEWQLLSEAAATEGLQLRPQWGRNLDAQDSVRLHAVLERGFSKKPEDSHALTWGRNLTAFAITLKPTNATVNGDFTDPRTKGTHKHVRYGQAKWLSGAADAVRGAERVKTIDAQGGSPGRDARGAPDGLRARTGEEYREQVDRIAAHRLGSAVTARGTSTESSLRAGDRIVVGTPSQTMAGLPNDWSTDDGAKQRAGAYGLTKVVHAWKNGLYSNTFEATPWQDYHPKTGDDNAPHVGAQSVPADGAHAAPRAVASGGRAVANPGLAIVADVHDPKGLGRVRVRYPWMAADEQSHWMRVAGLGGGNTRGLGVLPSVEDEVVVLPIGGDPGHAVVVGGLWNGVDKTAHAPGRQSWITPAGNTLVFSEGRAGEDLEKVELYSREGKAWVQLAQKGPTGVPTVTLHSEGDLSIEAPNGQVRLSAKSYLAHVAGEHATEAGTHTTRSGGAVTVTSGARLALRADGDLAFRAGGALRAHAGGAQTIIGAQVAHNQPGAAGPSVSATVPGAPASAWGPRPVPRPGPERRTQDPAAPRLGSA